MAELDKLRAITKGLESASSKLHTLLDTKTSTMSPGNSDSPVVNCAPEFVLVDDEQVPNGLYEGKQL
jgi:hypothetical protein